MILVLKKPTHKLTHTQIPLMGKKSKGSTSWTKKKKEFKQDKSEMSQKILDALTAWAPVVQPIVKYLIAHFG